MSVSAGCWNAEPFNILFSFIYLYRLNCGTCVISQDIGALEISFFQNNLVCVIKFVGPAYDRQVVGLHETAGSRPFGLHQLNLQQNDPRVSTSEFHVTKHVSNTW